MAAVSVVGGILGGAAISFYLAGKNPGSAAPAPAAEKPTTTVIQENKALKDAVAKVVNIAVGVKVTSSKGIVSYGSGLVFTSDGLVAVPYSLFPPGASAEIVANGKKTTFEMIKRDKNKNLAILKLENSNWQTASFYNLDNLKLGERVFVAGTLASGGNFVDEGVVRDFTADVINTSIVEKAEAQGSPVFDIEGNIMGIATVDKIGWVSVLPIAAIKTISGL